MSYAPRPGCSNPYELLSTLASTAPTGAYRDDIDGPRAVAVTPVMIYHLSASWLPGGLVGVDIYFAISGFVVSTSLGVEEQFYLVFPFLFFAWVALNDRKRGRILATALLASLGLAYFIACVYVPQNTPAAAFYSIFCRFWELAVGVLLYQLTAHSQAPTSGANSLLAAALPWLGAVVIIVTFVYASATAFPWFWAVPPVLGQPASSLVTALT